jgi:hypothetical protein
MAPWNATHDNGHEKGRVFWQRTRAQIHVRKANLGNQGTAAQSARPDPVQARWWQGATRAIPAGARGVTAPGGVDYRRLRLCRVRIGKVSESGYVGLRIIGGSQNGLLRVCSSTRKAGRQTVRSGPAPSIAARVLRHCQRKLTTRYREFVAEAAAWKRVHHLTSSAEIRAFLHAIEREWGCVGGRNKMTVSHRSLAIS